MGMSKWVHLEGCEIKRITELALLVAYEGEEYWLPKNQISDPEVFEEGDTEVTVSITEWIAGKKGIEVE